MSALGRLTTRAEWPLVALAMGGLLAGWWGWNRYVAHVYDGDTSEGGRFQIIRYATDVNPSRAEQVEIFNRYHIHEGLKAEAVANGANLQTVITTSAAGSAPDIIDVFNAEDLRMMVAKGIARPLNQHLKRFGIDLARVTWPTRLDELRQPNPQWKPGDDPFDRYVYYAVPNNVSTDMVWFNRSLYEQAREERAHAGEAMPPEPWLNWTWWDYAALGHAMQRTQGGHPVSFGAAVPDVDALLLQIGLSERGTDRAAFDALTIPERNELGIGGLSWDDCIRVFAPTADGHGTGFVNHGALEQALQYRYDLVHTMQAAPAPSDVVQMQTMGGFAGGGPYGMFKAGRLGMLISGRWFIGQVRSDVAFDWRLVRAPRWVPYGEWQRWQAAGLKPGERDGAWGEREHADRGYGTYLGGRLAILSSSAKDPDNAFDFLAFLVTNRDYNQALLAEDGMGADVAMTRDYLARPDPLFPKEAANRTPEHELGSLANLFARDAWPHANSGSGRWILWGDLDAPLDRRDLLADALAHDQRRVDYTPLLGPPEVAANPDADRSTPAVGHDLGKQALAALDRQMTVGEAIDHPGRAPILPLVIFTALYLGAVVLVWRRKTWRRRQAGAA
jgi:ABC-type glycerol-3-phosphate transport system substrate-binding protein